MPLPRQLVTLPFAFGVDTKTDAKQVTAGKLLELENGVFTTLKQLRKRNGYRALSKSVLQSTGYAEIGKASALTSFRDELLCVGNVSSSLSFSQLLSYVESTSQWAARTTYQPCSVSTRSIAKSDLAIRTGVDGATLATGVQLFAYEIAGAIIYDATDSATGAVFIRGASVANNAGKPRIVPTLNGALIYYVNTSAGTIEARSYLTATRSLSPAVTLTSVIPGATSRLSSTTARRHFDVINANEQLLLVFANDAGTLTVRRYDPGAPTTLATEQIITTAAAPDVMALAYDSTASELFCTYSAGLVLYGVKTDYLLTTAFPSAFTVATLSAGDAWTQAGAVAVPTNAASSRFYVFATSTTTATTRIATRSYATSGATSASAFAARLSLGLASKPWVYDGRAYVLLAFVSRTTGAPSNSGLQNQLVVMSTNQEFVARVLYGTSAGLPTTAITGSPAALPLMQDLGNGLFRCATFEASTLTTAVGDVQTSTGITAVDFSFRGAPLSDNRSELGGNLVLGGGQVVAYDGGTLTELGFWAWPDEVTVALSGGGALSAGQYQWVACYEWTDNNGTVHRSAPSLPVTLTATAGQQAALTVTCLPFTRKSSVSVVVYRTLANGTTFYRMSSLTSPAYSSISNLTVSITDTTSDATLQQRPTLYTTGGVVENIMPGPMEGLTVHRNRLFGIDSTNRLRLYFSKQVLPGDPVEFSDALTISVTGSGGDVTALASLDDKLVVFKRSAIFVVSGQGPDATGSQNDFSDAVLVTTDAGCIDGRSVVTTPDGLVFQSAKGIYRLDRSLQASYIGADVERYNSATVESAQLIPTANQVRFILSTGVALVFDYLVNQWSVFTNHAGVDSVVWRDSFCWARSTGEVMVEDPTRFDDAGSFVGLKIKTGWLTFSADEGGTYSVASGQRRLSAMQVFQRVRRMLVLGEYNSAHRLRVQVGFDFNEAPEQDVTITPTAPDVYGEGPEYGDDTPYGGTWRLYQWRVDLARQKCQAVQFTITEQRLGDVTGEGVRLSALAVDVGVKNGPNRVPMDRVVG